MVLPIQTAIAQIGNLNMERRAAFKYGGSNFTLLSAARISTGCTLIEAAGNEMAIYRRAYPFGLSAISVLVPLTCFRKN